MKKPSPLTIAEFVCLGGVIACAIAGAILPDGESPERTAVIIALLVCCLAAIVLITVNRNRQTKVREAEREREEKVLRDALASTENKVIYLYYIGKKKRLGAPLEKDSFSVQLYRTNDVEQIRAYENFAMESDAYDTFAKEAAYEDLLFLTPMQLSDIHGKTILLHDDDYAVMRYAPFYQQLFSNNDVQIL